MIGNINLATLEAIKKYVDTKYGLANNHPNKSQYSKGYCMAMKEVSNKIAGMIEEEIRYQNELLNAMYNNEFGEDGR